MSNVRRGLAAIKEAQRKQKEEAEARAAAKSQYVKATWFGLKDEEQVKLVFLQELDEEASGYDSERGIGFIAVEHTAPGPEGWKRRGLCTMETEGQCYACERVRSATDPKSRSDWRQRQNLYINVLVERNGEKRVEFLSKNANSPWSKALIEWATENDSITNYVFNVKRSGKDTDTVWSLQPVMKNQDVLFKEFSEAANGVELFDIEKQLREVAYDNQPAFYGEVAVESAPADAKKPVTADDEW